MRNSNEEGHPASVLSSQPMRVWGKWRRFGAAAVKNVVG